MKSNVTLRLLALLEAHPMGITSADASKALGSTAKTVRKIANELRDQRKVEVFRQRFTNLIVPIENAAAVRDHLREQQVLLAEQRRRERAERDAKRVRRAWDRPEAWGRPRSGAARHPGAQGQAAGQSGAVERVRGGGMSTKRGHIFQGSLAWCVIEFFKRNPDDELATEDIHAKWDVPPSRRVPQALKGAVQGRWLSLRRESRGPGCGGGYRHVYGAGVKLRESESRGRAHFDEARP